MLESHTTSPSSETSEQFVSRLAGLYRAGLTQAGAEAAAPYVLLDFPNHINIGDSAIWLGEIDVLHGYHGRGPSFVCDAGFSPERLRSALSEDTIIYLHGGGNFGDIWKMHQLFREKIIATFKNHQIIQLPQSVHYGVPEATAETKSIFQSHKQLSIMLRDRKSQSQLKEVLGLESLLVPDAAFCINASNFPVDTTGRGLGTLLRTDVEKRDDADQVATLLPPNTAIEDWRRPNALQLNWSLRKSRLVRKAPPKRAILPLILRHYNGFATENVKRGLAQLAEAQIIITDRLHGHILSTLLGKPHVAIDNSYGKIANFCAAFGTDKNTYLAKDYKEAVSIAKSII